MPDPLLTSLLSDRDITCPSCNYNLRGCTSDTCPECNTPLKLSVVAPSDYPTTQSLRLVLWGATASSVVGVCVESLSLYSVIQSNRYSPSSSYGTVMFLVFHALLELVTASAAIASLLTLRSSRPAARRERLPFLAWFILSAASINALMSVAFAIRYW